MPILDIEHPEAAVDRRRFVKLGAVGIVGAAGAAGWWSWRRGVLTPEKGEPFEAWKNWKQGEKPLRLVGAAILAASKHNTQPWEFRVEPQYIDVFVHPERNVGSVDPFRQEAYMGAGCALENLVIAAKAEGYATTVEYTPSADLETWVAKVNLAPGPKVDSPLYAAIPRRHTNRGPYDRGKSIAGDALNEMRTLVQAPDGTVDLVWVADAGEMKKFSDLTLAATRAIINDPDQAADNGRWYRTTWSEVLKEEDGMTIDATGEPITRRLVDKLFAAPGPKQFDEAWLERTEKEQLATAPMFGILTVTDPMDRGQMVKAGMAWQRIHLWATSRGLAAQPLTQALERANREKQSGGDGTFAGGIRAFADPTGCRQPIFAFRIGYPTRDAVPSPRRPVGEVVAKKSESPKTEEKA